MKYDDTLNYKFISWTFVLKVVCASNVILRVMATLQIMASHNGGFTDP